MSSFTDIIRNEDNPPVPANIADYGNRIDYSKLQSNREPGVKPSQEILLNAPRQEVKSVLKFCHTHFLRPQRLSLGIGPIGVGKSNLSEAIVSSHLNSHVDTFKIEVLPDANERPLLFIDFERTQDEILEGCDRILRRIHVDENPELRTETHFKQTYIHGFLQYARCEDKKEELKRLIKQYQPYLVILDGAASLVYDVNDTRECVSTVGELLATANEHNLSFFATVHPNPDGKADFKPRGVFGSELLRYAESVLLLKRAPDDRDTRILTTSFLHGKNRSGADNLESYFRWDDHQKMFTSCEYTLSVKPKKAEEQNTTFEAILSNGSLTYGELVGKIVQTGKSAPTAKRWISTATESGLIFNQNGNYGLSPF
jgi:hypothetical protein